MNDFFIDDLKFTYSLEKGLGEGFKVHSYPNSYEIEFVAAKHSIEDAFNAGVEGEYPLILIDEKVQERYFDVNLFRDRVYLVKAVEEKKSSKKYLRS